MSAFYLAKIEVEKIEFYSFIYVSEKITLHLTPSFFMQLT